MSISWQFALHLAELGYWVFPLSNYGKLPRRTKNKDDGGILDSARKLKLVDNKDRGGFYAAVTGDELETIREWAGVLPEANYGVVCGERCGLTVVDLDRHGPVQDGIAVVKGWSGGRELNCGFYVHTPSDGLHLYFKAFPGKSRTVVSGVELQNWGRYVVGPGCQTSKGKYVAVGAPERVLEAPSWLVSVVGTAAGGGELGSRKKSLLVCVTEFGYVPEGYRHDAVFMEAVVMIGQGMSEEETFLELRGLVDRYVVGGTEFKDEEIRRNIKNVERYVSR
jgi:hypothetical protein